MLQATPIYEVLSLPPTSSFTTPPNTDKTKVRVAGASLRGLAFGLSQHLLGPLHPATLPANYPSYGVFHLACAAVCSRVMSLWCPLLQ